MSKHYAIIIQFELPLTTFYRSGARRSDVYKRDAFVTSWRFHNRAWQPERHDRLPETLWIHRGALSNQRCSLTTGCGIKYGILAASTTFWLESSSSPWDLVSPKILSISWWHPHKWRLNREEKYIFWKKREHRAPVIIIQINVGGI